MLEKKIIIGCYTVVDFDSTCLYQILFCGISNEKDINTFKFWKAYSIFLPLNSPCYVCTCYVEGMWLQCEMGMNTFHGTVHSDPHKKKQEMIYLVIKPCLYLLLTL